jgi:hypothetical protein
MDVKIDLKNPDGNFALYEAGESETVELERYSFRVDAEAALMERLGEKPVVLAVYDRGSRQEVYRLDWPGRPAE